FSSTAGGGNNMLMTDAGLVEYSYISPTPTAMAFDENAGKRVALRGDEGKAELMAEVDGRDLTQIEQLDLAIAMMRDAGADEMVEAVEAERATLFAAQDAAP